MSNEIPTEKLVPIWIRDYIRDYVQQQLDERFQKPDSLGDAVPPSSGSAVRERWTPRFSSRILRAQNHNQNPTVPQDKIEVTFRVTDEEYQALIAIPLPSSAGGPPTSDLAAQPDSKPEKFPEPTKLPDFDYDYQAIDRNLRDQARQRIGVYDYDSCVSCLRINYKKAFGNDAPLTDPQDMIQRMAAEIQELRRKQEKEN